MAQSEATEQWWLYLNNSLDGPHSTEFVKAGLASSVVLPDTRACTQCDHGWRPLFEWPEFSAYAPPPLPPSLPTSSVGTTTGRNAPYSEGLLTNAQLPVFANWICVYGLCVNPILFVLSEALLWAQLLQPASLESPNAGLSVLSQIVGSLIDIIGSCMLFLGSWRLRSLRRGGRRLLLATFWFRLLTEGVMVAVALVIVFTDPAATEQAGANDLETISSVAAYGALCGVGLLSLIFEIASLVWLHRRLPWLDLLRHH